MRINYIQIKGEKRENLICKVRDIRAKENEGLYILNMTKKIELIGNIQAIIKKKVVIFFFLCIKKWCFFLNKK